MAAVAVTRAQNRAVAKGTDPKAATCRAKLQRARSALNRQMDRELRLREGAENLLRATTKDGGGSGDNSVIGGGRNKSKNRKLIRQTVALELSFLESNVRLLADELAELNGSVDVYQHRDDDDDGGGGDGDGGDVFDARDRRQRCRQRQMPMIAVPLKDTRPIDFGPPLERFISQHYGVDLSTVDGSDDGQGGVSDDGVDLSGTTRRRSLTIREAIDELTQLRMDTQTPSRDADGVRLLLRYYRQLYYVDRRFFPPPSVTSAVTTTPRYHHHDQHQQHQQHQQDHHYRHSKQQLVDTSSPPPAIYFEWYDSFGGPVPSCGQRTVRFEQACVLFNVAAVHTQMGAKHDRRCPSSGGGRDDDDGDDDDDDDVTTCSGRGKPATSSSSTSTGPDASDGASAAAQCFLRAAGAYRHIGDTFANAPARAADLRATGVLYTVMMAQANECVFEKLQWRLLASVRHRCRRNRGNEDGGHRRPLVGAEVPLGGGERRVHRDRDARTRRTTAATANASDGSGCGTNDATANTRPSWTELAREAAHVSRMYAEVVYNSCRPDQVAAHGGKENGGELFAPPSILPDVWVAVCRVKDRHYAALAYRYAACALLPYYRRDARADAAAEELSSELTAAVAAAGLELPGDDGTTSTTAARRRKRIGKLLLEAAAATHDRAARAQRLCRQLRAKAEGNAGGGLLAGVLDRERQRTVRLLMLHRRDGDDDDGDDDDDDDGDDDDDEYGKAGGGGDEDDDGRCCCRRRQRCCINDGGGGGGGGQDFHDCWSDDERADAATVADRCSGGGDHEEFTGIAGIPGLDVDRGLLIRPRTRFRLTAIAPDFTDTGDGDEDEDGADGPTTAASKRQGGDDRGQRRGAADWEERRADLFAGLGPVAVFSARHRCTRPRWVKVARGGRHRPAGDMVTAVGGCGGRDEDDDESASDPIQLVDRWFGFELRSHGGGTAAAVPPATVGHVRSGSQAQLVGLRRGDIVVALKCTGGGGSRVLDVRWDTCRRVAELVVHNHRRRRAHGSAGGGGGVQLKIVTPIVAASDGHAIATTDPTKVHHRRRTPTSPSSSRSIPSQQTLPQSAAKQHQQQQQQQRRQRRQTASGANEVADNADKLNAWSWNPFRRRRRSNKC